MSNDFLDKILAYKRSLLKEKQAFYDSLKKKIKRGKLTSYNLFKKAVSRPGRLNLIAEIKKASPSKGVIRSDFDVLKLAQIYADHNAAAISILTEDKYFLGKISYVKQVSENFSIPILYKDFIIDEVQILEAFISGASAVLLIVAILDDAQLRNFLSVAARLDLDCLVEVHDDGELERALKTGAEIIGINNRDLRTFNVDCNTSRNLIPKIPKDRVIVVESGIKTNEDIELFTSLGADAVLVGEVFLSAPDVGQKIKEIMGAS